MNCVFFCLLLVLLIKWYKRRVLMLMMVLVGAALWKVGVLLQCWRDGLVLSS